MAEVLIKIGDSATYKDGHVIAVAPDGILIPPSDMQKWFGAGAKEPAALVGLTRFRADWCRRQVAQAKAEIASSDPQTQAHGEETRSRCETWGMDTNWGFLDLKRFLAVRVTGLGLADAEDLVAKECADDYIGPFKAKRRWKIDWRALYPGEIESIENPELRVEAKRTIALPMTVFEPTVTS